MSESDAEPAVAASRQNIDAVIAKLDDPQTAAALLDLIDVLPTLSGSLQLLGEFYASSEHILENVRDNVNEVKKLIDLEQVANAREKLTTLRDQAIPIVDGVEQFQLLEKISDPRLLGLVGAMMEAASTASSEAAGSMKRINPFTVIAALRDHDVSRGMVFVLAFLKSVGAALDSSENGSSSSGKE